MNTMKTFMLMAMMTALIVFIGYQFGGEQGMLLAFAISILMNFGSYWFSDKIVLTMYGARELSRSTAPEIFAVVEKLARNANLPMPKVYSIPTQQPNAFATGRNPQHAAVAVTDGILSILTPDELEGVLAHELAHVKHRDILIGTIAATMAGAIMMIARFAMFFGGGDNRRSGGLGLILSLILAPIAAMLIQMAISRSREFLADEGGAQISGKPWALASALQKLEDAARRIPMETSQATSHMFIVSPLSGKQLASLFSTHPPTQERIARLHRIANAN